MGERAKKDAEGKKTDECKMEEDLLNNKRRAEENLPEKEPSEKKPKTNRKKKALAAGGVNMFGGKDLFGGKNPFAGRKQELSSDEEEEVEELETDSPTPPHHSHNGAQSAPPPPPPPPMSSVNIAVQPDADEKPVSFDDLPSDCHLMGSTTKSRVSNLPSRRRPTGKGRGSGDPVSNGHPAPAQADGAASGKCEQATAAANTTGITSAEAQEQTNKLTDRLALPAAGNESEEYDGDESELSRSVVKRGRRSIKKKQPPKGGVALFGGADLFGKGKNPFAHRQRDDSDEKEAERSRSIEPADDKTNDEITVVESQSAMEQRLAKVEREKRETVKREEQHDKKPDVVLRKTEKKVEEKISIGDEKGSDSPDSSTKVWEVKEDQKAAAVQRLLMKKVKEAKEKEAREAEEKKRKEEDKKKRVGGDVQADKDKKKREEEAAKRKLAEEKEKQRLEEEAAQWKKEEEALKRSQEERIKRRKVKEAKEKEAREAEEKKRK